MDHSTPPRDAHAEIFADVEALASAGDLAAAHATCTGLLTRELRPSTRSRALADLGVLLVARGRSRDGGEALLQALRIDPACDAARLNARELLSDRTFEAAHGDLAPLLEAALVTAPALPLSDPVRRDESKTSPPGATRTVHMRLGPEAARRSGVRVLSFTGAAADTSIIGVIGQTGTWEPAIGEVLARTLAIGGIAVDIGANVGVHTALLSKLVGPTGAVFAFEASSQNFVHLLTNLRQNGCTNVTPFCAGVWDAVTMVDFNYVERVAGCSFFSSEGVVEGETTATICLPLDQLFGDDHPRVSLLKIDVEGAEMKVLEGARRLIARDAPVILIEVNRVTLERFFGVSWTALADQLEELGYRGSVITTGGGTRSLQRLAELAPHLEKHPLVELICFPR